MWIEWSLRDEIAWSKKDPLSYERNPTFNMAI